METILYSTFPTQFSLRRLFFSEAGTVFSRQGGKKSEKKKRTSETRRGE
jgi:hypothetical protein